MIQHKLKYKNHAPGIPAREKLLTMYDLPSENPEEPGVPDQFHILQPVLLTETFAPPDYPPGTVLVASDLNLYYDAHNPLNYKRPDWYAVPGVPYLYGNREGRLSYVIWQEKVVPFVAVELISPGTEDEDLGRTKRDPGDPPTKWEVYEQILGIPYYAVYDRYKDRFRAFQLTGGQYNEMLLPGSRMWLPGLNLGLGLWRGSFHTWDRKWLRWYDADNNWIPTSEEKRQRAEMEKERAEMEKQQAEMEKERAEIEKQQAEMEKYQEKERAEQEKKRADIMGAKLRELGIDPESL